MRGRTKAKYEQDKFRGHMTGVARRYSERMEERYEEGHIKLTQMKMQQMQCVYISARGIDKVVQFVCRN